MVLCFLTLACPPVERFFQVAAPVGVGGKTVRQLTHVNGVEADELTLAEVRFID